MAMNKAEKQQVEDLKTQAALRWTAPVNPDVPIPICFAGELSTGYVPIAARSDSARVEPACSSSVHHGIGRHDKTTSQCPLALYSTRLLALKALRYQVEQYCAYLLRRVDAMIEEEGGNHAGN